MRNRIGGFLLILMVSLLLTCCDRTEVSEEFRLGTVCRITSSASSMDEVWQKLSEVEHCISTHDPRSELEILNAKASEGWVKVSKPLYQAISTAVKMADVTNGAFNPAIGAIVRLWDIGGENQRIPDPSEIAEALKHIDWHDVLLDSESSVMYADDKLKLDLGGLGKGLAADEAIKLLKEKGTKKALLNFGGNIACLGGPYKIGIQVPFSEHGKYEQVLQINDLSVVTSGAYEKNFQGEDGKLYHHIIDSSTGYPSESDLASVTIIGPKSEVCDMLSTACFVLGSASAASLLQEFTGYSAVLILSDGSKVVVGNNYGSNP